MIKNKINLKMQKSMFLENPEIYVKSLGSLKLKIMYLKQRYEMKFDSDPSFPDIL